MARMRDMLGEAAWATAGAEMCALWDEYEQGATPEAKLLKVQLRGADLILSLVQFIPPVLLCASAPLRRTAALRIGAR